MDSPNHDFRFTGDEGAIKAAREYLESLNISDIIEQLWLARYTYGASYAFLIPDAQGAIESIVCPNTKHIAIAPQPGLGARRIAYAPPQSVVQAIAGLAELPKFVYRPIGGQWNEVAVYDGPAAFEINSEGIASFAVPKLPNHIYSVPPLARAISAIDERRDTDYLRRATIKGFRSQLWLFRLENARKGEAAALRTALSSDAKTGVIVWGSNLEVQQHTPKSLDDLMGNETRWASTMNVYRAMGLTPRVVAGESPTSRSASGDSETDVALYMNRLVYDRVPFERFLNRILRSKFGDKAPQVALADIELAVAARIKSVLAPLMHFGVPSPQTVFQMAGLDPIREMQQHEKDWPWRKEYMFPYTGFSQAGPTGVTDSPSGGRPAGKTETKDRAPKEKTQASTATDYSADVETHFEQARKSGNPADLRAFFLWLYAASSAYRRPSYVDGYRTAGGRAQPDEDEIDGVVLWDKPNMDNFERDAVARVEAGESIDGMRWRALLYAHMGYKMAYMAGVFQAKREQGYDAWQRILHPESSEAGPCEVCMADAASIHPIEEGFWDHPNGVCGLKLIRFFRRGIPGATVRVPRIEATPWNRP